MNFTIIGFGEVGSLVGALINGRFNNSTLNIFDFPEEISGRILDFKHACACNNNTVLVNDKNSSRSADVVLYAAGYCNALGESRYTVAQKNKELIEQIFGDVQFKEDTLVIVVTNPVELASLWVHEALNGKHLVIGTGTSLDMFRLQFILSNFFQCPLDQIETLVLGEHGEKMVPIYSATTVNGKALTEIVSDEMLKQFTIELVNSASMIRKTESATKFGIAETCLKLILAYFGLEEAFRTAASMPYAQKGESDNVLRAFVSQLVLIEERSIKILNPSLTEHEQALFHDAVKFISR
jgi:malate/lactate dehydrogenase